MNKKGQAVIQEYVLIFFVVIAAGAAMTVFLQRAFEARIHDANNFMVNAVFNTEICDANCMLAAGVKEGQGTSQYEPYYAQMFSDVIQNSEKKQGATSGNSEVIGAKFISTFNETTSVKSNSNQMPPECIPQGNAPVPSYCADL